MSKKVLIIKPKVMLDRKIMEQISKDLPESLVNFGLIVLDPCLDYEFGEIDGVIWDKQETEKKPEVDFKAVLDDLIKKIDDEMYDEKESEWVKEHNRALRIAKAIVTAKKEKLYGSCL